MLYTSINLAIQTGLLVCTGGELALDAMYACNDAVEAFQNIIVGRAAFERGVGGVFEGLGDVATLFGYGEVGGAEVLV